MGKNHLESCQRLEKLDDAKSAIAVWPPMSLVAFMFFLSGACGLIYEVTWARILIPIVGTSTEAVTAVLSAFMGGLCIGNYLAARWGDRIRRPIFWYGLLEIGVGCSALSATFFFPQLGQVLVRLADSGGPSLLHMYRFVAAMTLMLVPTAAMGATLPVLSRYVDELRQRGGGSLGLLYGLNTLGATIGVLLAGFVFLPMLGARVTASLAVVVNLGLGLFCTVLFRDVFADKHFASAEQMSRLEQHPDDDKSFAVWLVPVVFGLSGMCAMGMEVVWTRLLIFFLSANSFVFSSVLATLLLCMSAGSLIGSQIARRIKHPEMAFALSVALLGVAGLASLWGALAVPHCGLAAVGRVQLRIMLIIYRILASAIVVLPSAVLMGAIFPFGIASYVRSRTRIARQTGTLCYANTLGAVIGPIVAGIVLIPKLGSQLSLTVLAAVLLGTGVTTTVAIARTAIWKRLIFASAVAATYVGVYVLVPGDVCREIFNRFSMSGGELVALAEGRNGVVTIHREVEGNSLAVNGIIEVPPDLFAFQTLRLLGHLPVMFHPKPRKVLTIGFGSGTATGALLCWPVESVDCVEICEGVPQMAGYFEEKNNKPLSDGRLRLIIDDARNYLLRTNNRYDVIATDATDPRTGDSWVLYTKEYYELCRDHLTEAGIVSQWVPMYGLPRREFERVLATFSSVFPHCLLFAVPGHGVVLGSLVPIKASQEQMQSRLAEPRVRKSLEGIRFFGVAEVMSTYVCDAYQIRQQTNDLVVNKDDLPYTAFSEIMDVDEEEARALNVARVLQMQSEWSPQLPVDIGREEWENNVSNKILLFEAFRLYCEGEGLKAYDAAAQLRRESPAYGSGEYLFSQLSAERVRYLSAADIQEGMRLASSGQFSNAAEWFEKAMKRWPDSPQANFYYAACMLELGDLEKAEHYAKRAVELEPNDNKPRDLLVLIQSRR